MGKAHCAPPYILCFRLFRFRYRLREYLRNETSGLLPQLFDYFRVLQILQNFALRSLNDALESLFGSTELLVEQSARKCEENVRVPGILLLKASKALKLLIR